MDYQDIKKYFESEEHKKWKELAGAKEDKKDLYIFEFKIKD